MCDEEDHKIFVPTFPMMEAHRPSAGHDNTWTISPRLMEHDLDYSNSLFFCFDTCSPSAEIAPKASLNQQAIGQPLYGPNHRALAWEVPSLGESPRDVL